MIYLSDAGQSGSEPGSSAASVCSVCQRGESWFPARSVRRGGNDRHNGPAALESVLHADGVAGDLCGSNDQQQRSQRCAGSSESGSHIDCRGNVQPLWDTECWETNAEWLEI